MLKKIREAALNLLAIREHSRFELKRKLRAKDFANDDIEKVLADLAEQKLQSDARFTECYVAMRTRRGFGPIRIQAELSERGIAHELIETFLTKQSEIWQEVARKEKHKKFGKEVPRDMEQQAKQMRYLYYKGFDSALIRKIFRNAD